MKDLYLYGEQFVNFPFDGTESGVSLPIPNTADPEAVDDPPINKRYPVAADADALFSAIAPNNVIKCDGRIDFSILSRLDDTSK